MGGYEKRVRELIAAGRKPVPGVDLGHPVMDLGYEPMDVYCTAGHKVRFTGNGGYADELGSYREVLKAGEVYTVAAVTFGEWAAHVSLVEFPGRMFDAVVFEDAPGTRAHEETRLAEIGKSFAEMTACRLDLHEIVDAVVGDIAGQGREDQQAGGPEGAKDGKVGGPADGTVRKFAPGDENSIDLVHCGAREGPSPIVVRKSAFAQDPIAIGVLADHARTGHDAGIPVDLAFEDASPLGRSAQERLDRIRAGRAARNSQWARFSDVDVRNLALADDLIPLPDMTGEARPVVASRTFGVSDKAIAWGARLLGIATAILTAAIFLHFFGLIP